MTHTNRKFRKSKKVITLLLILPTQKNVGNYIQPHAQSSLLSPSLADKTLWFGHLSAFT